MSARVSEVSDRVGRGSDAESHGKRGGFDRMSEVSDRSLLAFLDVADPCAITCEIVDIYGIAARPHRRGWVVRLPEIGLVHAPGEKFRSWLTERARALVGGQVPEIVIVTVEEIVVARAIAREQLEAQELEADGSCAEVASPRPR